MSRVRRYAKGVRILYTIQSFEILRFNSSPPTEPSSAILIDFAVLWKYNKDTINYGNGDQMLSEQLKLIRKANGFTQQALADAVGIERSTYASYETGRNKPDVILLKRIANAFGVSSDFILEIDTTKELNMKDVKTSYDKDECSLMNALSKDEKEVIAMYRLLPKEKKEELCAFLGKNTKLAE